MGHGVSYSSYAPERRCPHALAIAASGGLTLVCPPDGVHIDEVLGRGRDASVAGASLVFGGPKCATSYTADEAIRFAGPRSTRVLGSAGSELQFASSIVE